MNDRVRVEGPSCVGSRRETMSKLSTAVSGSD